MLNKWDILNAVQRLQSAKGADLSEVTSSSPMDGGVPPWGGPRRVARPAEEGGEGALAAAKEAPALLWGCPVMTKTQFCKCSGQGTSGILTLSSTRPYYICIEVNQLMHSISLVKS